MTSAKEPHPSLVAARTALRELQSRWAALSLRDRRGLTLATALLVGLGGWSLAIAPAWRSLNNAPAQIAKLETQQQQMQLLANEAAALRAASPVSTEQAHAALTAATARLGAPGKLSLQGDRALLALKAVNPTQLGAWLAEARAGARARVVEANLSQTTPGLYDGSLTLALGTAR